MPSIQTALPPELANNSIRLYRECLRRAKYIGQKKYNTELVMDMVRQQFKRHMHETDPEKIQKLKDDAARGLINHMLQSRNSLQEIEASLPVNNQLEAMVSLLAKCIGGLLTSFMFLYVTSVR